MTIHNCVEIDTIITPAVAERPDILLKRSRMHDIRFNS